jgi:hypothetical protein
MRHVRDVAACKRSNRARGGWTKSSLSMSNGHCVEVSGLGGGHIGIRDSKDRSGPSCSSHRTSGRRFWMGSGTASSMMSDG